MKKVLSLFLTVVMALSMFSCLSVVTSAATSDLVVGQEYTVASGTTLTFIPEESGSYQFESFGYGDPVITINCQSGEYEFDDTDEDYNFCGIVDLEAGEEVSCYLYDYDEQDCEFKITKVATPKVTFTPAEPIEIIENTHGYWESYEYIDEETGEFVDADYYYYDSFDAFAYGDTITVEYPDGTVDVYSYDDDVYRFYNDSGEILEVDIYYNQRGSRPWTVDSENFFFIEVLGKKIKVPVTIVGSPYKSIEFIPAKPLELVENTNGYWDEEYTWDENGNEIKVDYYRYYIDNLVRSEGNKIVVNYNDGTSDTYTYQECYNEEYEIYYYDFANESGEELYYDYSSNQWYEERWTVGSDNYFTIEALGSSIEVPVTILESPVLSIEFIPAKPLELVENIDGYETSDLILDENDDWVHGEYFCYDPEEAVIGAGNTIIVNYKDGRSVEYVSDGSDFININDETLAWECDTDQSYENQWNVGVNKFTLNVLGKTVEVPITVVENPYESIEFIPANPLYIEEYTYGYWMDDGFCYDSSRIIEEYGNVIRLNKKDGTTEEYTHYWWCFENSDGERLNYGWRSNDEEWGVGSDNYFTIVANGVECTVYVTITDESKIIQESSFVAEKISEDTCVITQVIEPDNFNGVLDIPETVNGCKVVGIEDGVLGNVEGLKTVNLPASFSMISSYVFDWCDDLEAVNVSADNSVFASVNGILYNKALTEILYCPENFTGVFVISAGVTEISDSSLIGLGNASSVQIEAGNTAFANEDGILYNADFTKIYKAFDVEGDYVMKSTVKEVADYAFNGKDKIESVVFAAGVTEISYAAFSGCTSLESVDLPDSLVTIGTDAFSENTALSSVTLPASTKRVEENAFFNCDSLTELNLNDGIEYLGCDAFNGADIRKLVLPDSLEGMSAGCFRGNSNLSEITFGSGLGSISDSAFEDCSALKNVDIPENIIYLGMYSFAGSGLTSISLHNNVWYIRSAFESCSALESAYIGNGIQEMEAAFRGCKNLVDVQFADGFNGNSKYAFVNCTKLEGMELPTSVTEISYGQFKGCTNIEEFDLPDDLLIVKAHSFDNTGLYNNHADGVVYVDHVAYGYKGTMTANYKLVIKEGTKSIAESAFEDKTNLVSVQLPSTLEYVGAYAFDGTSLTAIYGVKGSYAEEYAELMGYEFKEIENHTHTPSDWIVDKDATCTEAGSQHKECKDCGETLETATISAKGHTEVKDAAVAASCTTAGKTEGKHCSVCNTVIVAQQTVPAKGHTSSALKYNEKTRTEYKECTACKVVLESKYIPVPTTKITSCYNEVKGVQLKWNAVSDATSYKIYRKLPSQTAWTLISTETGLAYQDTKVAGNTVYQYVIKAVDKYGNESANSAQRECRFIATPKLASRENAVGGVKITWEKVAGATSYRIYRRGAGTDNWYYLGDVNSTQNTFFDKESSLVTSGNYYRYTVRASYSGKDSAGKDYLIYSGFDTNGLYLKYVATPKLTSISNATGGLQIKWTAVNGGGRMEYRVYRRGAGSTSWTYLGTTTGTTWTDSKIANANGNYYRYTVRAVQGTNGEGWYSAFDTTGLYLKRLANPTLKSAVSSKSGITVKWSAVTGTTGYYVYRKTANSSWVRIASVGGTNTTSYLDKTAKKGTTYTYTVRAVYGSTTSYFNSGISCKDKY